MKKKVWIIVAVAVILVLGAGTITAQNILGGNTNMDFESAAPEVLSEEGNLIGRIDNHSVEIEVNGEIRAFGLSDALREVEFAEGPISFKYYVDENGSSIITEADWTKDDESGVVHTAAGVFNGQADNHTVEIRVDSVEQSFTFVDGIAVDELQPGDLINFDYREDATGRLVIVKLKKTGSGEKEESTNGNLQRAEGILNGRIDNHSVEIEVNGEIRAFGLSDALREVEYAEGPISFKYYVDENGSSIITEADWTKDEGAAVQTAEGIFNGLADSHTVEIEVEGQPRSYGLAEGISFTGIKDGETVFIAYREIGGRLVIVKVEKMS